MNISQFLTKLKTLVYSKNEVDTKLSAVVHTSGAEDISGNKNFIDNLTCSGKNVEAIEEQGDGYIRYTSGVQMCCGGFDNLDTSDKTIAFPKPFRAHYLGNLSVFVMGQNAESIITLTGWNEFKLIVHGSCESGGRYTWLAIGRWK